MRRRAIAAKPRWLALGLGLTVMACDPARPGPYQGNFPDPVHVTGLAETGDVFMMSTALLKNHRRWHWDQQSLRQIPPDTRYRGYDPNRVPLWLYLAYDLDYAAETSENYNGPAVSLGIPTGVPDYVYVASDGNLDIRPVGLAGPTLRLSPGFHVLHRTCQGGVPNNFEEVPLDSPVVYSQAAAASQQAGLDSHLESCGIKVTPSIDLGDKIAIVPTSPAWRDSVADLVWSPASDVAYVLAGVLGSQEVKVLSYKVGTSVLEQVDSNGYYPPLQVATGGTSLLVTRAGRSDDVTVWPGQVRWAIDRAAVPDHTWLPLSQGIGRGSDPIWGQCPYAGALSPDGRTVAVSTYDTSHQAIIQLIDVVSGGIANTISDSGIPLTWDLSGQGLLVADTSSTGLLRYLPVDAASGQLARSYPAAPISILPGFCPQDPASHRAFWSASGPKLLVQDDQGAGVYDVVSGRRTDFVEADHVAPASAPLGVVVAREQVFAWAMQCWGLAETSCTSELRRLSLATGTVDVVASADGALPFAVSPDGSKLAITYKVWFYLKTLAS